MNSTKRRGEMADVMHNRQAIVSLPHLTRPLLASIDPTPARLRLVD